MAADQVSISNSIGSLRFLERWLAPFVETMSAVDQVLREDPAGAYGRMDFTTSTYRHVVEEIQEEPFPRTVVAPQAVLLPERRSRERTGRSTDTRRVTT